ncbi:hypothetical protein [Streptomyces sp. NRRL S-1022]|nr:hypothetical protein [Streptomyces sp. NRRL S-1022]
MPKDFEVKRMLQLTGTGLVLVAAHGDLVIVAGAAGRTRTAQI